MTVPELIAQLQAAPQQAIAVDGDDLEIIAVISSDDGAVVALWSEPK